ncbi:MAG TPA: hypothetical protein VGX03_13165 [Candidatus Binatia bacterium]|jgi:hypothetical protein|nr:hypothetical protein [Candidatus Binatia bacterium]
MKFAVAQKIADAVLYEGYLLYPYRRSAVKNQARWQFGVLIPRSYSENRGSDPWSLQTECLVEPGKASALHFKVRFLQLQARSVEEATDAQELLFRPVDKLVLDGKELFTWEEAIEREVEQDEIAIDQLLSSEREFSVDIPGGRNCESLSDSSGQMKGRIVRERWAIHGRVRLAAESLGRVIKIRMQIENLSECPNYCPADRTLALRQSLIATHTLLSVSGGAFVSLIDPPEWARDAATACVNLRAWPVLVGEKGRRDVMLSAPIILYDYPQVAPESPGDLFDLTEIDELLTLCTMALSENERREVRGTDGRGAAILDRIDNLPDEILGRLHGSVRYFRAVTDHKEAPEPVPGWNPDLDGSVSPETDQLVIGGVLVSKGSRVVLQPGCRPADAQDMFCRGRTAVVEAIFSDVDGKNYLAVTLLDDPGADLQRSQKRFRYFSPDEVEPVE